MFSMIKLPWSLYKTIKLNLWGKNKMFSMIKLPRSLCKTLKFNLGEKQDVQYDKTAAVFI